VFRPPSGAELQEVAGGQWDFDHGGDSIAEANESIKSKEEDELDQFQRRALEYTSKFSKLDAQRAEKLVEQLVQETGMPRKEAIMVVNVMPRRTEELTGLFSSTMKRFVSKADAEKILKIIKEAAK
jgi:DNA-directed RNA polymerase subunit F